MPAAKAARSTPLQAAASLSRDAVLCAVTEIASLAAGWDRAVAAGTPLPEAVCEDARFLSGLLEAVTRHHQAAALGHLEKTRITLLDLQLVGTADGLYHVLDDEACGRADARSCLSIIGKQLSWFLAPRAGPDWDASDVERRLRRKIVDWRKLLPRRGSASHDRELLRALRQHARGRRAAAHLLIEIFGGPSRTHMRNVEKYLRARGQLAIVAQADARGDIVRRTELVDYFLRGLGYRQSSIDSALSALFDDDGS